MGENIHPDLGIQQALTGNQGINRTACMVDLPSLCQSGNRCRSRRVTGATTVSQPMYCPHVLKCGENL
jgi:hypothetical protein